MWNSQRVNQEGNKIWSVKKRLVHTAATTMEMSVGVPQENGNQDTAILLVFLKNTSLGIAKIICPSTRKCQGQEVGVSGLGSRAV